MITIEIDNKGKITAGGMIPGQVILLKLPHGKTFRITRFGESVTISDETEVK